MKAMATDKQIPIERYLDNEGRLKAMPAKRPRRLAVLNYVAQKFSAGMVYTEKEVNSICDQWHTFNDYFYLRRELIDAGFLARERDGSAYWRTEITLEQAFERPEPPRCCKV